MEKLKGLIWRTAQGLNQPIVEAESLDELREKVQVLPDNMNPNAGPFAQALAQCQFCQSRMKADVTHVFDEADLAAIRWRVVGGSVMCSLAHPNAPSPAPTEQSPPKG